MPRDTMAEIGAKSLLTHTHEYIDSLNDQEFMVTLRLRWEESHRWLKAESINSENQIKLLERFENYSPDAFWPINEIVSIFLYKLYKEYRDKLELNVYEESNDCINIEIYNHETYLHEKKLAKKMANILFKYSNRYFNKMRSDDLNFINFRISWEEGVVKLKKIDFDIVETIYELNCLELSVSNVICIYLYKMCKKHEDCFKLYVDQDDVDSINFIIHKPD